MGFFERFSAKKPEGKVVQHDENYTDKVVTDQKDFKIPHEYSQSDAVDEVESKIATRRLLNTEDNFLEESEESNRLEKRLEDKQPQLVAMYDQKAEIVSEVKILEKNIEDTKNQLELYPEYAEKIEMFVKVDNMSREALDNSELNARQERLIRYLKSQEKELRIKNGQLEDIESQIREQENLIDGGAHNSGQFLN